MKKIILKELRLVGFKGVSNFTLEPNESKTSICGRNGLGKTSVFDALTWLLFGKDSQGNSQFAIKTVDSNGDVIPKMPHEVSAVLLVDCETITLRRVYEEKWTKHRGTLDEVFEGNKESYFFNDVPCKKQEYQSKVAEICNEDIFKLITSPNAFTSLPWPKQRDMLFEMAGAVSDEELAKGNTDYEKLLEHLTNKSLEDYKKEISSKRSKVKKEVEGLPLRIDEVNRSIPSVQDWVGMEAQLKSEQNCISEIDDILSDLGKAQTAEHAEHDKTLKKLSEARQKKSDREFAIRNNAQKDYFEYARKRSQLTNEINDYEQRIASLQNSIQQCDAFIAKCNTKRESLLTEWREINAMVFKFDESSAVCPTCHRAFEPEQVEDMRSHLLSEFNSLKADKLSKNKEKGIANKAEIEKVEAEIMGYKTRIKEYTAKIGELKSDPAFTTHTENVDATPLFEGDMEWKIICEQIEALEVKAAKPISTAGDSEREKLRIEKTEHEAKVRELTETLAVRKQIQVGMERKAELESQLKELSQLLADLEKTEFVIQSFTKARVEAVSDKINSLFKMVRFRLFELQINGCEKECCVATVNGVSLPDVNQAHKVLAGLDILQAISRYFDVASPVFVDAAESINEIPPLENAQLIELRVTEDEQLIVK